MWSVSLGNVVHSMDACIIPVQRLQLFVKIRIRQVLYAWTIYEWYIETSHVICKFLSETGKPWAKYREGNHMTSIMKTCVIEHMIFIGFLSFYNMFTLILGERQTVRGRFHVRSGHRRGRHAQQESTECAARAVQLHLRWDILKW